MGNDPVTQVLKEVVKKGDDGKISFGEIVEALESRGFGPLLFIPSFIAITPAGVIPGVPSFCAVFIILVAGQMLFGRKHPWLPSFLKKLDIKTAKYKKSIKWAQPVLNFIDKITHKRFQIFTGSAAQRVIALVSVLLAFCIPPLEILPFAVFVPALALLLFSFGLILHDGLVTLLGFAAAVPVFYLKAQALL